MGFDRRAFLTGTLATVAGITGAAGAQSDGAARQAEAQRDGTQGQPRDGGTCPAGTTVLASYETQRAAGETDLQHTAGSDVVTFDAVERRPGGQIAGFDWTSTEVVALVEVAAGPRHHQFEGGFEGTIEGFDGGPGIGEVRFCAPRGGRAITWAIGGDGTHDIEFQRARPEDERESGRVAHVRTDGYDPGSLQYAFSSVTLLRERGEYERLRVGDLDGLSVDYYQGAEDDGVVPDGLFVSLLTEEGDDAEDDQLELAFTRVDEAGGSEWRTADVREWMRTDDWRVTPVGIDDLQSGAVAAEAALRLRDDPDRDGVALTEAFADATVASVGIGAGSTSVPTAVDRYYDELVVEWDDQEERFAFPVSVPADVDVERDGGSVVTTLTLQREHENLAFGDVDEETVTLAGAGPVAPPVEPGLRARPGDVEVLDDERLEISWQRGRVQRFRNRLAGDRAVVHGDFGVDDGSAFYGVGRLP